MTKQILKQRPARLLLLLVAVAVMFFLCHEPLKTYASDADLMTRARRLHQQERCIEAIEAYIAVIEQSQDQHAMQSQQVATAMYEMARCYKHMGEHDKARAAFEIFIYNFPEHEHFDIAVRELRAYAHNQVLKES